MKTKAEAVVFKKCVEVNHGEIFLEYWRSEAPQLSKVEKFAAKKDQRTKEKIVLGELAKDIRETFTDEIEKDNVQEEGESDKDYIHKWNKNFGNTNGESHGAYFKFLYDNGMYKFLIELAEELEEPGWDS